MLNRWNMVIAGNMNSGKTTFARAVLKEISELCPRDRLLILEDTPELRSESPNTHLMRKPEHWELTSLVTITLRKNAKRICASEDHAVDSDLSPLPPRGPSPGRGPDWPLNSAFFGFQPLEWYEEPGQLLRRKPLASVTHSDAQPVLPNG